MKNLSELTPGKYTIVGYSDFGFLYCRQIHLKEVEEKPYAQYPKVHLLKFIVKGKRTLSGKYIFPNDHLAIWKGWVNPDTDMWKAPKGNVTKSKYYSFSADYLKDAINSIEELPLIVNL